MPTYTAHTPEDLLAAIPLVLGFVPRQSVVMLTMGEGRGLHARVDLPGAAEGRRELARMAAALLGPARAHGVRRVVLVAYAGGADAARLGDVLLPSFERAGVAVVEALVADGRRWFPMRDPGASGREYDLAEHPFTAEAVFEGRVTHASRADLASSLAGPAEAVAEVAAASARLGEAADRDAAADAAWAERAVSRATTEGSRLEADDLARLLVLLRGDGLRRRIWPGVTRESASSHVAFWSDVVRRAPPELAVPPATLLALAAWRAGSGALAWCALDRCPEAASGDPFVATLTRLLVDAVPPWGDVGAPAGTGDHALEAPRCAAPLGH